ncbi:pilus assembly protein [Oligoflexia bacterium]|nr:pilus assembly protein [Oligoflexia bacterium]
MKDNLTSNPKQHCLSQRKSKQGLNGMRGAAMVEAVLIIPVLSLTIFSLIDIFTLLLPNAYYAHQTAYEIAAYAARQSDLKYESAVQLTNIQNRAETMLEHYGVTAESLTIHFESDSDLQKGSITIELNVDSSSQLAYVFLEGSVIQVVVESPYLYPTDETLSFDADIAT